MILVDSRARRTDCLAFMATASSIVLYVEDEEIDRFLMQRAFGKEGLATSLHTVNDGQAALDYLAGLGNYADRKMHPLPELVLLDLNLPELHGFEVLQRIRTHPANATLPVVIFSSSEREEDQARARLLGANDYFKKPSSGLSFQDVVRKLKQRWLSVTAGVPLPALYPASTRIGDGSARSTATPPCPGPVSAG